MERNLTYEEEEGLDGAYSGGNTAGEESKVECLGSLILIGIVIWFVYNSAYSAGKREGSRKGYGVGFDRGRRSQASQSGCLLAVIICGLVLAATTAAFACIL